MHVLKIIFIISMMLLSACTSISQPAAQEEQQAASPFTNTIHMTGRFSIHVSPNHVNDEQNQNNSLHGSFDWVQTNPIDIAAKTKVTFFSPFKQTLAIIEITPQLATLTQVGKTPQSAPDADTLVSNLLGWPLPISGLRQWLQGNVINADGVYFTANPENNLITTQDGWRIHYISWKQDEDKNENATTKEHNQPKRIDLTRTMPAIGEVTIRIMIDNRQ